MVFCLNQFAEHALLNTFQVANVWQMLKIMHCVNTASNSHQSGIPSRTTSVTAVGAEKQESDKGLCLECSVAGGGRGEEGA